MPDVMFDDPLENDGVIMPPTPALEDAPAAMPMPSPIAPPDLGLGQMPMRPSMPAPTSTAPTRTQEFLRLALTGLAAGLGPGRGTGILQGLHTNRLLEQQQAQQTDALNYRRYQDAQTNFEQEQRVADAKQQQRLSTLTNGVEQLRRTAPSLKSRADFDTYVDTYAKGLNDLGYRISGDWLRSVVPYVAPRKTDVVYGAIEKIATDARFKDAVKSGQWLDFHVRYTDPETGQLQDQWTVRDLAGLVNYPLTSVNGTGVRVSDNALTATEAAGKAGVFATAYARLKAGGASETSAQDGARAESDKWEVAQAGSLARARNVRPAGGSGRGGTGAGAGDPDILAIVDAIESGEQPPTTQGLYGRTLAVRGELSRRHVPIAKLQLQWTAAQRFTSSLNSPQMMRFQGLGQSVVNTIDELRSIAQDLKATSIQQWNKVTRDTILQVYGNSPESALAARYLAVSAALKEELAGLVQGGYAPTEAGFALASQMVNQNYGFKDLDAALSETQRLINYRLNAFDDLAPKVPAGYQTTPPPKTDETPKVPPTAAETMRQKLGAR